MIELLGSLPTWAGGLLMMLLTTLSGLVVYLASHKLISKYQQDVLTDSVGNLFRVTGILVSLMLSLAFTEAIAAMRVVESAIEREAVAISDIFIALRHYDGQASREIRSVLIEYANSVSEDEWPALANDHLGLRTNAAMLKLGDALLELKPTDRVQEVVWSSILADLDVISDNRLIRLNGALSIPPVYTNVVVFGFLVTMACFGVYRPQPVLVALVSLYTLLVGLGLYLIIALSDPFHGGMALEPTAFRLLAETMASELR
jgi:hypothetical protein